VDAISKYREKAIEKIIRKRRKEINREKIFPLCDNEGEEKWHTFYRKSSKRDINLHTKKMFTIVK